MFPVTTTRVSFLTMLPTVVVSLIVVLIVVYFTRPGWRRLLGAVAAGVVFMLFNAVGDVTGYYAGWWHYLFTTAPFAPPLVYIVGDSVYGIGGALIGWRVQRRFGLRGLLIFLALLSTLGSVRDVTYATEAHLFAFGPGVVPILADWLFWATLYLLAQLTMRIVAGPAHADRLGREARSVRILNEQEGR
jgi:hypothetical protein